MNLNMLLTLCLGGVTVGALHALAPDHWVPFAALSRARGWSAGRTARITILCGVGHVTVSAVLGLVGLAIGIEMIQTFGRRMESVAGVLLIAFGLVYGAWGLRRAAGKRLHGHPHTHYDHVHESSRMTTWSLFLLFSADPCVAVIPLIIAAEPLGLRGITTVVLTYELATLAAMVLLVLPARAGVTMFRAPWIARYEHAAAGAFIVVVGVVVGLLGM